MLKVYHCFNCGLTTYLQFEKDIRCKRCPAEMVRIRCPFEEFVELDPLERIHLINKQRHDIKWEYADYDYTIKISDVVEKGLYPLEYFYY